MRLQQNRGRRAGTVQQRKIEKDGRKQTITMGGGRLPAKVVAESDIWRRRDTKEKRKLRAMEKNSGLRFGEDDTNGGKGRGFGILGL